jgi:hypothetical protein
MNVSSLNAQQRRAIDQAKELLVAKAEKLLDDAKVTPSRDFGHSQLRNLVAVAMETESPAVVLNFIRYQMGRDNSHKNWSQGPEGTRLGDRFLGELGNDKGTVTTALAGVKEAGGLGEDKLLEQLVRMELIRYFLGFATRYMKFLELKARSGGGASRNGGGA